MTDYAAFQRLSPNTLADTLTHDRVMNISIRPLWQGMPRVAGPAYTVRCAPADNLMLHAAIYRAAPGSIIVVQRAMLITRSREGMSAQSLRKHGIAAFCSGWCHS